MTASLRHRRHANRFAQLLDEADGGRRHRVRTRHDEELTELVTLRQQLAMAQPTVELDPEFRTGLRAMLVATAEREGIGRTAAPAPVAAPPPRRGLLARTPRARTAVIAGVAVGAVAFAGMSTASENAVPGDALYGVKRSAERAQLALSSSDIGRGELYLDFARTRLDEAQSMAGGLDRVLTDMDRETSHGVRLLTSAATSRNDLSALAAVDGFVESQQGGLTSLAERVGGDDLARVNASLALLDEVAARSAQLRQALRECEPATAIEIDSLGPLPADCVFLPVPGALPSLAEPPVPQVPEQPTNAPADRDNPDDRDKSSRTPHQASEQPQAADGSDDGPSQAEQPAGGDEPTGEEPDDEQADDSGLLGGLGRLVGNLLGS